MFYDNSSDEENGARKNKKGLPNLDDLLRDPLQGEVSLRSSLRSKVELESNYDDNSGFVPGSAVSGNRKSGSNLNLRSDFSSSSPRDLAARKALEAKEKRKQRGAYTSAIVETPHTPSTSALRVREKKLCFLKKVLKMKIFFFFF